MLNFADTDMPSAWLTNHGADGIPCTEYPPEVLAALTVILLERTGGFLDITPEESDRLSRMLYRPQHEHDRLAVYRQTYAPYRFLHAELLPAVQVIEGTLTHQAGTGRPTDEEHADA